jgi:DNA-binding transcriptional LysR family regulator
MPHETKFLRAYRTVCEEGGFGRAARRLYCTQPAVTYQIRALERDVGATLIERGSRHLILTAAGRRLFDFCRRYLDEYESVCSMIGNGDNTQAEPLRIASVSGFGRFVLFPSLIRLISAGPRLPFQLDLRFRTASEVFRLVEAGDVDFGAVYLPKVSNYLTFVPLYAEELVLIVGARARVARKRPCDWTQLSTYESVPFITYLEGDYVFGRWFDAIFGKQPRSTTSKHHFDELEEVVQMVTRGHGLSIVPLDSVQHAVETRQVRVMRPVRGRRCINQVFSVTRAGAFARPEIESLRSLLENGYSGVAG